MTCDVPVKDNCPICGQTMFKKSGRGFKKPFCINEKCPNFLPEDQRGYKKKPAAKTEGEEGAAAEAETTDKKATAKKSAAKKSTTKKATTKKTTTKKTTTKKASTAKKTTKKKAEETVPEAVEAAKTETTEGTE